MGLTKARPPVVDVGAYSLSLFNATGDGIQDDTVALQAAANSGLPIVGGGPGKKYKITAPILWPSGSQFNGQGCTIDASANAGSTKEGFLSAGSANAGQAIASGAAAGSFSIVLTNTPSGIAEGDWVLISSADIYPYVDYSVSKGENLRVRSVDSGTKTIVFTTPLIDTYTTTPVVRTVNWKENVHFSNFTMIGAGDPNIPDRGVCFRYVKNFSISNVFFDKFQTYTIEVSASILGTILSNTLHGNFYNGTLGTIYYGIAILDSCSYLNVSKNKGDRNRHLVITTARSQNQLFYGQPTFCDISENLAWDSMANGAGQSYLFEIHGFGRFNNWHHNIGNGGHSGIRIENGNDCTVEHNTFINYAYSAILVGGDGKGTIRNLSILNNRCSNQAAWYTGENLGSSAIYVDVTDGGAAIYENLRIHGNLIRNTYTGTFYKSGIYIRGQATGGYVNCSICENQMHTDAAAHDGYSIILQAAANGFLVSGNRAFGYLSGINASAERCVIKNNTFARATAAATGFGLYSNGLKNVFQNNVAIRLARLGSLAAGAVSNLAVNNQSLECTTGTIADAGTLNVLRDNDAIAA